MVATMSMLTRDLPSYRRQGSALHMVRTVAAIGILVFLLTGLVGGVFLRTVRIQSDSMQPGLPAGTMVFASPLLFGKEAFFSGSTFLDFSRPVRGDLVLLEPPYRVERGFFGRLASHVAGFVSLGRWQPRFGGADEKSWESSMIIRRVIGLPGDQIYLNDGVFFVKAPGAAAFQTEFAISGKRYGLKQPAEVIRDPGLLFTAEMSLMTVPEGSFFVAADNREHGLDSRHWGTVPPRLLRGAVLLRYWPFSRLGWTR
jgi:signal peptidase I